jgi:4-hydroxy-4-methyl-2-oxoglutarate aldolase
VHIQPTPDDLIELTALNPFERFPDGRPRVPDDLLERMKLVTTEEAWSVLRAHGYHRQFEGGWM